MSLKGVVVEKMSSDALSRQFSRLLGITGLKTPPNLGLSHLSA
jgi:hypothetical protein